MSRSASYPFNGLNIGNRHKIVRFDSVNPTVYCPTARDNVSGTFTSIGCECDHCNVHF